MCVCCVCRWSIAVEWAQMILFVHFQLNSMLCDSILHRTNPNCNYMLSVCTSENSKKRKGSTKKFFFRRCCRHCHFVSFWWQLSEEKTYIIILKLRSIFFCARSLLKHVCLHWNCVAAAKSKIDRFFRQTKIDPLKIQSHSPFLRFYFRVRVRFFRSLARRVLIGELDIHQIIQI